MEGQAQLAEKLTIIEDQRAVLRELSVPLLPLSEGVMVMPLIGVILALRSPEVWPVAEMSSAFGSAKLPEAS